MLYNNKNKSFKFENSSITPCGLILRAKQENKELKLEINDTRKTTYLLQKSNEELFAKRIPLKSEKDKKINKALFVSAGSRK